MSKPHHRTEKKRAPGEKVHHRRSRSLGANRKGRAKREWARARRYIEGLCLGRRGRVAATWKQWFRPMLRWGFEEWRAERQWQ